VSCQSVSHLTRPSRPDTEVRVSGNQSAGGEGRNTRRSLARCRSLFTSLFIHSFLFNHSLLGLVASSTQSHSVNRLSFVICHLSFVICHPQSVRPVSAFATRILAFCSFHRVKHTPHTHGRIQTLFRGTVQTELSFHPFSSSVHQSGVRRFALRIVCMYDCAFLNCAGGYPGDMKCSSCALRAAHKQQFGNLAVWQFCVLLVVLLWCGRAGSRREKKRWGVISGGSTHLVGQRDRQRDRQTEKKGMMTIGKVGLGIGNWELGISAHSSGVV